MASSRDRALAGKPLVAVPAPVIPEPTYLAGVDKLRSPEYSRRLYDLSERVLELEVRLRERVESERVLEAEVRSQQRDAELRHAYVTELEGLHNELVQQHAGLSERAVGLQNQLEVLDELRLRAETEERQRRALEARAAVRVADALAARFAGHPGLVRVGAWMLRRVARRFV